MRKIGYASVLGAALAAMPCLGAVTQYLGGDPGVGPGGAAPNSQAAATSFLTAASSLGTVTSVTFEALATGDFVSATIAPGTVVNFYGNDSNTGIVTDPSVTTGYNTTPGGSKYLKLTPMFDIGTAGVTFHFDQPITAFGAYITGLGTAAGQLHILFSDGTAQDRLIAGSATGGIQFLGYTGFSQPIDSISLELQGVSGTRDIFGIDDLQYVPAVPEPTSIAVLATVAMGLIARPRRNG